MAFVAKLNRVLIIVLTALCAAVPLRAEASYAIHVNLYEAFPEAPKGVFASFHPKMGTPTLGDASEQGYIKDAVSHIEALPVASLEVSASAGKITRIPVAYFSYGKASRLDIEIIPFPKDGHIALDAQILMDGNEFLHASTAAVPGKLVVLGGGAKDKRKFVLALRVAESKIAPTAVPNLKTPARWPVYPEASRAAGKETSLLLTMAGTHYDVAGNMRVDTLQETMATVKTWGDGVAFVHFRAGKVAP